MIRARTGDGLFILGIDAENVRRLRNGNVIMVDMSEIGGRDHIMIMYGDTLADIASELEAATGKPLPAAQPMSTSKVPS